MQAISKDDARHPHRFFRFAQIAIAGSIIFLIASQHFMPVKWQPESTNIIGYFDFKFKAKHLESASQPWRYTWHNSGTVASVEHISNLVAGKGKLIVHDGAGNEVYSRALGEDGSFLTNPGVAGEWTIQVVFENETN
jgi:hypothetical protein